MSTCPFCGAQLFPSELAEGQCTSCMRQLPSHVTADAPTRGSEFVARPRDDWPVRRSSGGYGRSPERWRMMRIGLLLLIWGMVLYLLYLAASALRVLLEMAQLGGRGGAPAAMVPGVAVLGPGAAVSSAGAGRHRLLLHHPRAKPGAGGWVVGVISFPSFPTLARLSG